MRAVLDTATFIWVNIMKEFSYQGWDFRVDTERAAAFYRNAPVSAHGLSEYLPELTAFMRALEIDIEKPFCISAHDPHYFFSATLIRRKNLKSISAWKTNSSLWSSFRTAADDGYLPFTDCPLLPHRHDHCKYCTANSQELAELVRRISLRKK